MFWHNFKYSLKTLLKNKMLVFWTLAFPLILGIFFHMAFSDIEKSEKLETIDIAIVSSENTDHYKEILESMKQENGESLFQITYADLDRAKELLASKEITGYLVEEDNLRIVVSQNGINETILRFVIDEINSNTELVNYLVETNIKKSMNAGDFSNSFEKIYKDALEFVSLDSAQLKNVSNQNLSYTMIEYYTLIAMACLYGGILSMFILNYRIPNMKPVGKRSFLSPVSKGSMILSSLLASYLLELCGMAILFLFTIFVLGVDYGSSTTQVILLSCVGSLAGLSMGILIATLCKTHENAKTGILIAVTMAGCFLSGMMGITMKYVIDKNIPLLNKINPANMITDGLYSLYYYDTYERYILNIISLLIFSAILLGISFFFLRRQKYDSL